MDQAVFDFRVVGLCAAPYTPFHADGSIDWDSVQAHADELVKQGVKYAFVNGTTGEGLSLSISERKKLVEKWMIASAGKIAVIVHVGAEAIPDMQEMAAHAASNGAVAISIQPTTFFKPDGVEGLINLFEKVVGAAPTLPFYYYHIPVKTAVNIRPDLLLKRIAQLQRDESRLTSFRGVKYSNEDLHIGSNCIATDGYVGPSKTLTPRCFDILYGKDEQLLGALPMGFEGAVGSTYNYMGRLINEMMELYRKGEMEKALEIQRKSQEIVNLMICSPSFGENGGPCTVHKAIHEMRLRHSNGVLTDEAAAAAKAAGKQVCFGFTPRVPLVPISQSGIARLRDELTKLGFFTW